MPTHPYPGQRLGHVKNLSADSSDLGAQVDLEAVTRAATGATKIGGENIREGLVIRAAIERYSAVTAGRAIAKLISPSYLLRTGGTEFE